MGTNEPEIQIPPTESAASSIPGSRTLSNQRSTCSRGGPKRVTQTERATLHRGPLEVDDGVIDVSDVEVGAASPTCLSDDGVGARPASLVHDQPLVLRRRELGDHDVIMACDRFHGPPTRRAPSDGDGRRVSRSPRAALRSPHVLSHAVTERSLAALRGMSFAPGASPFHVKGLAYRGHLAYAERFVPGGNRAILGALEADAQLEAFFAQSFLASSRYDVMPLALAGIGASRVTGLSFHQFVRIRSGFQAREDMNGVYRMMLNLASPELVATRFPKLMLQYFDFARTETTVSAKGHVRCVTRQVPLPLVAWMSAVAQGYLEEVFRIIGARGTQITYGDAAPAEALHGVTALDVISDIRWKA